MSRPTKRELGLLKGSIRRVFSRSELRKSALDKLEYLPFHVDPDRPRVKRWLRCPVCREPEAQSAFEVDHTIPVVPYNTTFVDLIEAEGWDMFINERVWCAPDNLQAMCCECHDKKSAEERKLRKKPKRKAK